MKLLDVIHESFMILFRALTVHLTLHHTSLSLPCAENAQGRQDPYRRLRTASQCAMASPHWGEEFKEKRAANFGRSLFL